MKKHLGRVEKDKKTNLPFKYIVIYKYASYVLTRAQAFLLKQKMENVFEHKRRRLVYIHFEN